MDINTYEHTTIANFRAASEDDFLAALDTDVIPLCGMSMFGGSCQYAFGEGGIEVHVFTTPEFDYMGERAGSVPPSAELDAAVKALAARYGFTCSEWEECEKGWGTYTMTFVTVSYHIFVDGEEFEPEYARYRNTLHVGQVAARRVRDSHPGSSVRLARRVA